MAAVIKATCKVCGAEHELCLPTVDFFEMGTRYQYACPQTGDRVEFPMEARSEAVPVCPTGSVRAQRAH